MAVYFIVRIEVTDPENYVKYASKTLELVQAAGGDILVKGGAQEVLEGNAPDRHVIVQFPTKEAAMAWYNSPGYQEILPIALRSSNRDFVLVEGV